MKKEMMSSFNINFVSQAESSIHQRPTLSNA